MRSDVGKLLIALIATAEIVSLVFPESQVCTKNANPRLKNQKPVFKILFNCIRGDIMRRAEQTLPSVSRVAQLVVSEINNIDRLDAMLELGMILNETSGGEQIMSGCGCGAYCPGGGIVCGLGCLMGGMSKEAMEARFAIDVVGTSGITAGELAAVQQNYAEFQRAVAAEIAGRLSPENMKMRMKLYGRKRGDQSILR